MCSAFYINGRAHFIRYRYYHLPIAHENVQDGETIHIEPWRSAAFPVIKDLVVDGSALIELW